MGGVIHGVLDLVGVCLVLGAVAALVFGVAYMLSGGSDKPNGGQQTTNVHVNVQVNAAPAPAYDQATMQAQAMQAALHAQAAHAALYGPPATYGQPIGSAAAYGQLPYTQATPAVDQRLVDQAVEAALQRRVALPPGSER